MKYQHCCSRCGRVWGHEECTWDRSETGSMPCWICNPSYFTEATLRADGLYSFESTPDYTFDPTEDEFTQWVQRVRAGLE